MKNVEYYTNGILVCGKRLMKKMTVYDFRAMTLGCFTAGVLTASFLPRVTKKLRGVLTLASIVLMLPVLIKGMKIIKDVFHYRWDWM